MSASQVPHLPRSAHPDGEERVDGLGPASTPSSGNGVGPEARAEPLDTVALATGMLMERHREDVDSASARLATLAGDAGLELAERAARMVTSYGGPVRAAARTPAVVTRALEFMDANAARGIDIDEIARATHVGARALQAAFRKHRGQPPLEYLRGVRMRGAHHDLVVGDPTAGDTVADIAARWRFGNPGRFSVEYRRSYGCSPSTTLRRRAPEAERPSPSGIGVVAPSPGRNRVLDSECAPRTDR
jgi:AraC-like DNA-binding protein